MDIFIKNMVCNRCIMVVRSIFTDAGWPPATVELGKVTIGGSPNADQLAEIQKDLVAVGFEILADQKHQLIEKIKNTIRDILQQDLSEKQQNFSQVLSAAVNKEYSYISKLFSEAEGITIEKFIIDQKIEMVKEQLAYGEKSLGEIAFDLGYSSIAHLSTQFKKNTGFTPSEFRKLKTHHRKPLG